MMRALWLSLLLVCAACAAQASTALDAELDLLVRDGFERPAQSLAALREWQQRERTGPLAAQRSVLLAIGSVQAQTGAAAEAGQTAEQLVAMAQDDTSGRSTAAANLVRAQVAQTAGQLDVAAALAQSALEVFAVGCEDSLPVHARAESCEHRSAWRALEILERRAIGRGILLSAEQHAQRALQLAEAASDPWRAAYNAASLAIYAQRRDDADAAQRLMAQAKRLAVQANDLAQQARVANLEARLAGVRDDRTAALHAFERAYGLALRANAPRLQAQLLNNLSDAYSKLARYADALRAAEQGIVIVRRYQDLRMERVLINNAGIAKIGLGRLAEGRQDMARVLEMWEGSGETARKAETLREFGEALARAGDVRGALDLYHRERALSAELMRANRSAALKELQARNDAEARQRDIELLARDNALKNVELGNHALMQRIGWLIAAVAALAGVLVTLLYRRVRETHRRLSASHKLLQVQSERDPLTDLANRRHFQAVMAQSGAERHGFEGTLLLIDIDHFKRVNDQHGHAAGDRVIVEVARRLADAVRAEDLVVRWGGEEFLVLAPRATPEQADQMAERVLRSIGATPVGIGAGALRVTASIGYARFPLRPHDVSLTWEQAINLADMALYTAKNQGRNRAIGIAATIASDREALRAVEADFERAWYEGQVTLTHLEGPSAFGVLRAA
ncbi:MAG TPA: diguanylate cyclase [Burkholderiaceae bacterium]